METRKWLIIFVITAIAGKFFAMGLNSLHLLPEPVVALEKAAVQNIKKLFFSDAVETTPVVTKQNLFAQTLPKPVVPVTAKPILFGMTTEKKAELVKAKQTAEEKARRKKRKKKLEEAADKNKKKPTVAVQHLGDDGKKKSAADAIAPVSYSYITTEKKEVVEPTASDKQKVDLTMWLSLLLANPTEVQFKPFYALYKSGQINATEYYGVVAGLQKSPKKEARRLSIRGSNTEIHSLAFQVLARVKYSETDTELQTLALQKIQNYKDAKYLSLLMDPMSRGDLYAKVESSDIVGHIAQSFQGTSQTMTADARMMFNRYVSLLTRLSMDPSEMVKAKAAQSLILVKQILGITA